MKQKPILYYILEHWKVTTWYLTYKQWKTLTL